MSKVVTVIATIVLAISMLMAPAAKAEELPEEKGEPQSEAVVAGTRRQSFAGRYIEKQVPQDLRVAFFEDGWTITVVQTLGTNNGGKVMVSVDPEAKTAKVVDGAGEHYMAQVFAMYLRFRDGSDLAESEAWQAVVMADADLIMSDNPGRTEGTLFWYGLEQYLNGSLKSEAASEFFRQAIAALGEKR